MWGGSLLVVQTVQIGRGMTTREAMRQHKNITPTGEFVTSVLTSGATSFADASLAEQGGPSVRGTRRREGWWSQCRKLLGLDVMIAAATGRGADGRSRSRVNPFDRGWWQNYKDFFCDGSPVFASKAVGEAMLGGELVNYTTMFEAPRPRNARNRGYEAVDSG